MIPFDKFKLLLEKLLTRSHADEVEWQNSDKSTTAFEVRLPESMLRIQKVSPSIDPDYYWLQLFNKEGVKLIDLKANESEDGNVWLPILTELYAEAFRCRTGWDKILADLESAVGGKSHVGVPF